MQQGHLRLTHYTAFKKVVVNPELHFSHHFHKVCGKKETQNCVTDYNTDEKKALHGLKHIYTSNKQP